MRIKFDKVLDSGSPDDERLLFSVLEPCNLGNYVIALAKKKGENSISSELENIKWLNDVEVKAQDIVVIYTHRQGDGVKKLQNNNDRSSYFQFWNLKDTLKSLNDYSIVCFETTWSAIDVDIQTHQDTSSEGD